MMMRIRWMKWVAICVICILPLPAGAGESPLSQLPADTPILISLHGVHRTKQRLAALMENAVPDLAKTALAKMDWVLGKGVEGRKLAGLDPDGPVFMALTSLPQGGAQPAGAIVAKVTDYKAFRDSLLTEDERKNLKKEKAGYEVATIDGREVYLIHRKSYVVLAGDKDTAELFLGDKGSGLEGKLSKRVAGQLLESDAALYVNMKAVNKEYGEMLQTMRQLIPTVIDQAAENSPGQLDKNSAKFVKAYLEGLFQAIQDSSHVLLTVSLPPEGLALHVETGISKDAPTNKLLAEMKAGPLAGLATLPPGYLGYVGIEWDSRAYKTLEPLVLGFLGSAEGAQDKALHKALDELIAAGPGPVLMASGPPKKGLQVLRYAEPAKAVAAQLKLYEALRDVMKFANMPLKEKPVLRPDAENYRGSKFHYFSVKWDLEKQFENLPGGAQQMAEALKKMTGEGVNVWFGALEGNVVSVQAKDWKTAEKLLGQYLDKNANVGAKYKSFDQTRARLPAKATVVALASVPQMIDMVAQYAAVIMQAFGMPAPQLPPAKGAEPFLGVGVTLGSGYAGLDLWVPAETARHVRRVVEAFKGAAGAQ